MTQLELTDDFIDHLCENGRFINKIRKIHENDVDEKDLTLEQCSQMQTYSMETISSHNLIQEISILLMENINKQVQQQLQYATQLTHILLKEVKNIKTQIKLQPMSQIHFEPKKHQNLTKKQHEVWAKDLIDQINSCIHGGLQNMDNRYIERFNSLEMKIDGKLQKNTKTLHDLHHFMEENKQGVELFKRVEQKKIFENKKPNLSKTNVPTAKIQLGKSWDSLSNFFKIGVK